MSLQVEKPSKKKKIFASINEVSVEEEGEEHKLNLHRQRYREMSRYLRRETRRRQRFPLTFVKLLQQEQRSEENQTEMTPNKKNWLRFEQGINGENLEKNKDDEGDIEAPPASKASEDAPPYASVASLPAFLASEDAHPALDAPLLLKLLRRKGMMLWRAQQKHRT